jgi:hypothetical protein
VSLRWDSVVTVDRLVAHFVSGEATSVPTRTEVRVWDGQSWTTLQPVRRLQQPDGVVVLEFDPVATTELRLEMDSAAPGGATGFIRIAELEAFGYAMR